MARLDDPILTQIENDLAAVSSADESARIIALRCRNPDDLMELARIRRNLANIKQRCFERLASRKAEQNAP